MPTYHFAQAFSARPSRLGLLGFRLICLIAFAALLSGRPASAQTTPTTVNDTDPGITYSGSGWGYYSARGIGDFQDDIHATSSNGASASYPFTGTAVTYITELASDEGNVQVYLDGTLQTTVNCNSATRKVQQAVWSKTGLAAGTHTLKLVKQDGGFMILDAVQVTAAPPTAPVTINDTDTGLVYSGSGWGYYSGRGVGDFGSDVHATANNGDAVSYTFTGSAVSYLTETSSDEGNVQVYLDGTLQTTVSAYSATRSFQQALWSKSGLTAGSHTLKLVKLDGGFMLLDALQITPLPPVAGVVNDADTGLTYAGSGWGYYAGRGVGDFQDDVHATYANGASVSYTFTGTGIGYVTELASDEGNVQVYLDGTLKATVNCYSATRKVQQTVWSIAGLGSGSHTLKLVKVDGGYMVLDILQLQAAPVLTSITVSPASVTLTTDGTQTFTAVAKDQNGTALATQPAFTWTVMGVGAVTSAGVYSAGSAAGSATVKAASGTVSGTAAVTVNVVQTGASASYNLFTSPVNVDVTETTSGSVNAATVATVSPINSFAGSVKLSASGLPSGVSVALGSPAITITTGSASSNVTFTIASTTRPGFYPIDLRAISGSITKSTPINLTISPPTQTLNFTVTEDVDGLEIAPGSRDVVSLALSSNAGFSGTVTPSLQDDPANPVINGTSSGIVATFSNSALSSGSPSTTLTVQVGAQVAEGTYHFLVKASSSTGVQTLILTIFVSPNDISSGYGPATSSPSPPHSSPNPLASDISDMTRYDLNDSNNGQSPTAQTHMNVRLDDLGINFATNQSQTSQIHPNYLGATDDRISIRKLYSSLPILYPYSSICRINAIGPNGISIGTGVLIGRNHVLTAAHVLYDNSGHRQPRILVYPGYDNGASRIYHRASAKSVFIPPPYKAEVLADPTGQTADYDDWAIIDLNPIVAATRADRGKGLGDIARYMFAEDDFVNPDVGAIIAGYPGAAVGIQLNSNHMYFSNVYNGDDGPVMDHPPGNPANSDNLVYYTIDVSDGDSGAPIFRPDPVGNDDAWHLFAIVRAGISGGANYNDGTLVTKTRKRIIQQAMQKDGDDISY